MDKCGEPFPAPVRRHQSAAPACWRLAKLLALTVIVAMSGVLIVTDASPTAVARSAPSAEQVAAGRDAVYQLRASQQSDRGVSQIRFGTAQLDGLSALATHGFRPDRLDMYAREGVLYLTASHSLRFGRWLNVQLVAPKPSHGFPQTYVRIGSLSFSPTVSRMLFELGRRILRFRGVDLAPLDNLVRSFSVEKNAVFATVDLPARSGLLDQIAGDADRVDPALVAKIYCQLADAQGVHPEADLAVQVRRAFPATRIANADAGLNRAAFVALAMLVVDKKVGQLAKLDDATVAKCPANSVAITLHNRADLAQHFALSAALSARTGAQLAEAMGEWKELADSLAKQSEFQIGDPSGFSFVDLASDRSGFRVAQAATSVAGAKNLAQRLSVVTETQILPSTLLGYADGLSGADFTKTYGGINDQRYLKTVARIDGILSRNGLVGL